MASVLWTGKLSVPMKLLVNTSSVLAWFTGNARDTEGMKQRVRQGYEGAFTDHVTKYDELGLRFQTKAASVQLDGLQVGGRQVLDVGAGTGALTFLMLEAGAEKVTCGDISEYMLSQCRGRATREGYGQDRIAFRILDAESLPFDDNSFDVVVTGMTLGLLPDQSRAIQEMARVARPGGVVSVGAHGPAHYWEPIDAFFSAINKRYVLAYRLEFWPRTAKEVHNMMVRAGLSDVHERRNTWENRFPSGGEAFDFFMAISSAWWYARFPEDKRRDDYEKVREHFIKKNKNVVTDDIIIACGHKPPGRQQGPARSA